MPALTETAENRTLNWLTGRATTAPVLPLRVRLMITAGDDINPGTPVTGAPGNPGVQVTFGTDAASGQISNTAVVRFDNMPLITGTDFVRAFEIWDSTTPGAPVRWWWAELTTPRQYQAGDAAEFPIGELVLAMD